MCKFSRQTGCIWLAGWTFPFDILMVVASLILAAPVPLNADASTPTLRL